MAPVSNVIPVKEQILDAALRICVEEGLEKVSMRRIAAHVGVTAPAIYRHYQCKQAVVQAVIDRANQILGSYLYRSLQQADPWQRLLETIRQVHRFAADEPRFYELLFLAQGRIDMDRLPDELNSANFVFWLDRVRECLDAGLLKPADPIELAITIWAHFHGLLSLHLTGRFGDDKARFERLAERSLERLFDGVRA